jgi:hypothetical protein
MSNAAASTNCFWLKGLARNAVFAKGQHHRSVEGLGIGELDGPNAEARATIRSSDVALITSFRRTPTLCSSSRSASRRAVGAGKWSLAEGVSLRQAVPKNKSRVPKDVSPPVLQLPDDGTLVVTVAPNGPYGTNPLKSPCGAPLTPIGYFNVAR